MVRIRIRTCLASRIARTLIAEILLAELRTVIGMFVSMFFLVSGRMGEGGEGSGSG